MLGTLRSELDDSDSGIDPGFETLSSLAGSVRTAFLAFRIGPTQAARLFATLRLQASDGHEWTVGPTSGAWYKRQRGETTWRKAPMPIGITPANNPEWLQTGIAAQLQSAENEAQIENDAAKTAQEEAPIDPFAQGALNPFQRKDLGSEIDGISPAAPRAAAGGEDVDWIFEEWDDFDRRVRETREAESTKTKRPALGKNLPPDLDPDKAMLPQEEQRPPVTREGSRNPGDAPVDRRSFSPEEFFLSPDDPQ
jgi:hypothetical protein